MSPARGAMSIKLHIPSGFNILVSVSKKIRQTFNSYKKVSIHIKRFN